MRLGCCGGIDNIEQVRDAGFDFLEVGVQPVLRGDDSDADWRAAAPDPDKLPLPIEAANSLLPVAHPVVGPQRDMDALRTYMGRVAERAARIGIQRLVFGSGKARVRPEGVSAGEAMDQLAEFCRMAGDLCHQHGVTLVIEHLHQGETNTINSLADELTLVERANHPGVQALVDSFHYGLENETDEAIIKLGDYIRHVHVAEPVDRLQPGAHGTSEKAFDFESFFCSLRKVGYDERVSIEAKWNTSIAEAGPACVELLRQAWQAAGRCEV